jgi:hypothetical protein
MNASAGLESPDSKTRGPLLPATQRFLEQLARAAVPRSQYTPYWRGVAAEAVACAHEKDRWRPRLHFRHDGVQCLKEREQRAHRRDGMRCLWERERRAFRRDGPTKDTSRMVAEYVEELLTTLAEVQPHLNQPIPPAYVRVAVMLTLRRPPVYVTSDAAVGERLMRWGTPLAWPDTPATCHARGVWRFANPRLHADSPYGVTDALAVLACVEHRQHDKLGPLLDAAVLPQSRARQEAQRYMLSRRKGHGRANYAARKAVGEHLRRTRPEHASVEDLCPWYRPGMTAKEAKAARKKQEADLDKEIACGRLPRLPAEEGGQAGDAEYGEPLGYSSWAWTRALRRAEERWYEHAQRQMGDDITETEVAVLTREVAGEAKMRQMATWTQHARHRGHRVDPVDGWEERVAERADVRDHSDWGAVLAWAAFAEPLGLCHHSGRDARTHAQALVEWAFTFLGRDVGEVAKQAAKDSERLRWRLETLAA